MQLLSAPDSSAWGDIRTLPVPRASAPRSLGATVIEKHVTLKRADVASTRPSPWNRRNSSPSSRTPASPNSRNGQPEAQPLPRELSLGRPIIGPKQAEQNVLRFRRSLYVTQDVHADGLAPDTFQQIGRRPFRLDAKASTPQTGDLL
ncbi:hypothetical protein ACXC9Q_11070 [Kribbella sp. CWNU-51]